MMNMLYEVPPMQAQPCIKADELEEKAICSKILC